MSDKEISFRPASGTTDFISIEILPDESKNIPALTLEFDTSSESGFKYISKGSVVIKDRDQVDTKEYKLDNSTASVFYDSNNKIVCINLYEILDKDESDDVISFLKLTKDPMVIRAYEVFAWYWTSLSLGFNIGCNMELGLISPDEVLSDLQIGDEEEFEDDINDLGNPFEEGDF